MLIFYIFTVNKLHIKMKILTLVLVFVANVNLFGSKNSKLILPNDTIDLIIGMSKDKTSDVNFVKDKLISFGNSQIIFYSKNLNAFIVRFFNPTTNPEQLLLQLQKTVAETNTLFLKQGTPKEILIYSALKENEMTDEIKEILNK